MSVPTSRRRWAVTALVLLAVTVMVAAVTVLRPGTAPATPTPRPTSVESPAGSTPPSATETPIPTPEPTPTGASTSPTIGRPKQPNIVVLMLDDMPPEPRLIERMPTVGPWFAQGLQFEHYIGNDPLCCPGRAAFLSGQYSHHHGVTANDATLFDPRVTIATRLQDAGYHTMLAGKYLNLFANVADKTPPGWDRTAILADEYYDYDFWRDGKMEHHGSRPADYSTDVVAKAAVRMLEAAPPDKPIFLELTPFAVHSGLHAPLGMPRVAPRYARDPRCIGIGVRAGPAYEEADVSDKPAFFSQLPALPYPHGWPLITPCRALLSVDEMFSNVLDVLQREGRLDDTMFVLLADNGMAWGDHRWWGKRVSYATPLPLYVRWDALHRGPGVVSDYVTNVDLAPTLAAIGGTAMGQLANGRGVDGLDVSGLLDGTSKPVRQSILEERASTGEEATPEEPGWWAIRTTDQHPLGLWHYIEWNDGQRELYDLSADPAELTNVAGEARVADVESALHSELLVLSEGKPLPAHPGPGPAGD
jgi:N-acetylglucosamine-6-sulfatase